MYKRQEYNFEEYKQKFRSINDIKKYLRPGIDRSIVFTEDEDLSVALEDRFAEYKSTTMLPLSKETNDAEIFWFALFSYLSQAFDILPVSYTHLDVYKRQEIYFDVSELPHVFSFW